MTKRMLIDASHAEETRVVVLDGNRLEDFDVETSTKRQLKGNIYLAKVVRVEPSLQAAFVEYGGNRHGFLAFSEIHPDYYQIPVADRQRLIEMEAEEARLEAEEEDRAAGHPPAPARRPAATPEAAARPPATPAAAPEPPTAETGDESGATGAMLEGDAGQPQPPDSVSSAADQEPVAPVEPMPDTVAAATSGQPEPPTAETGDESGTTGAVLQAAGAEPDAAMPGATAPAEARQPDVAPEPPAAETSDESGATGATVAGAQPGDSIPGATTSPPTVQPQTPDVTPEPPAAETSDELGATGTTVTGAGPGDSVPGASASPQAEQSQTPEASPEPPIADVNDESGAADGDEPDDPEPTRGTRRRAQPMIIEPETLSGPVETAEAPAAGESPEPAEASDRPDDAEPKNAAVEPPVAEAGAADAAASDTPDAAEEPARPRRSRRRSSDNDEATGEEDAEFGEPVPEPLPPETVGGESDGEDHRERRIPPRFLRNYKIQEVIKRRQIMLVQVVKEERGTKGAALTTYISLAGRFSVLMPNSPRGGGISRKITSATDRRRLKDIVTEMDMPKGMGLIVRTAGANRPKPEIKRDCEYLLRLWDDIREHTLKSVAPALIYEEASLIKRAIRDVYSRDIDEIQVDGEGGWKQAHDFMRMLMPSHARKVQLWRDGGQPLFARYQVEAQLDNMLLPTVQLRSGGYLVINQTEALVAIDVNSGRSTRERNVEETALRTNLEAADEAARQLRLRDLAGLIVIDFIDMESKKHNAMVEKRLKDALKSDRARIQVGHISHFGLLEMSRQRLRPSLAETSFIPCPHCGGTGHVRSTESAALHVLRGIEEEGSKRKAAEVVVYVATPIALYILNHKRDRLHEIELRYGMRVTLSGDDRQIEPQFRIDRLRPQVAGAVPAVVTPDLPPPPPPQQALPAPDPVEEEPAAEDPAEAAEPAEAQEEDQAGNGAEISAEEAEGRRRRRRRRRRGRREDTAPAAAEPGAAAETQPPSGDEADEDAADETHIEGVPEHAEPPASEKPTSGEEEDDDDDGRGRRRGRRGGRRRRREPSDQEAPLITPDMDQPELPPLYAGPTPANPFGGHAFDIFDMLEQAEGIAGATPGAAGREAGQESAPDQAQGPGDAEPVVPVEIMNTAAPEPATEEAVHTEGAPETGPVAEPVHAAPASGLPEPAQTLVVPETPVGEAPARTEASPEPAASKAATGEAAPETRGRRRLARGCAARSGSRTRNGRNLAGKRAGCRTARRGSGHGGCLRSRGAGRGRGGPGRRVAQ